MHTTIYICEYFCSSIGQWRKKTLSPIIYLQILMMRIPAEIYDYVSANKRHLVIPHRLMPYPEEVHIYAYIFWYNSRKRFSMSIVNVNRSWNISGIVLSAPRGRMIGWTSLAVYPDNSARSATAGFMWRTAPCPFSICLACKCHWETQVKKALVMFFFLINYHSCIRVSLWCRFP